jgi:hypothetical protein
MINGLTTETNEHCFGSVVLKSNLQEYKDNILGSLNKIFILTFLIMLFLPSFLSTFLPLDTTALDECWPHLQPASTAIYPSSSHSILLSSSSSDHSQHHLVISSWVFLFFFWNKFSLLLFSLACPNYRNLCDLINLTISSPFSNAYFILH